jgi:CheY-like chemotaxis protein
VRRAWVVEDNDPNFELVEFLLVESGWAVERARDTAEFAAMLEREPPDLILLDMNLPDAAGLELLAELRGRDALVPVPVVAITAHAMRGDRERFLAAGCDAYLSKPIDTAGFVRAIEETIARRRR